MIDYEPMIKPTILSLSLLTIMSGAAVGPALANIATAFPDASPTSIKLILTVPAIFIIIFSFISGWLSIRFSKRYILIFGLIIYLIGGLGGGLTNSIEYLLVFRALLGVGVGLIVPLSTGLIADFYAGDKRAKLMGYSTASSNLGGIVFTLVSGILATLSWRFSFGIYLLGLIVLVLVLVFLPEPSKTKETEINRRKLPVAVYGWGICAFLFMLSFYAVPMNLAIFMEEQGIGGSALAGLAISLITFTGFLAGLLFGRIRKVTATFLPSLVFAVMAAGYFILSQASSLVHVLPATAIIGLGLGWGLPTIYVGATKAGDGRRGGANHGCGFYSGLSWPIHVSCCIWCGWAYVRQHLNPFCILLGSHLFHDILFGNTCQKPFWKREIVFSKQTKQDLKNKEDYSF